MVGFYCSECFWFRRKSTKEDPVPILFPSSLGKRTSPDHLLGVSPEDLGIAQFQNGKLCWPSRMAFSTSYYEKSNMRKLHNGSRLQEQCSYQDYSCAAKSTPLVDNGNSKLLVTESCRAVHSEDPDGNKMINEYVRVCKIGIGSYGKVVLHRSRADDKLYAIKIFRKSRLSKIHVGPAETAMMDVLREVAIMKQLDHPNIVKLVEVIDDPEIDHLYMVLEYVAGRCMFEGSGPPGGIDVSTAMRYFRDGVSGLMYLHSLNIVHGDIKPENLLISSDGHMKVGDFGVSCIFKGNNDVVRRSPGTPVYTAPECCTGVAYHGKAADVWALGCTLYCMVLGHYPFAGETIQDTYDKIVQEDFNYPDDIDPDLLDLLQGLLCKDPNKRLTLEAVSCHPWVVKGYGPLHQDS